jgi:hypothetical protein
MVHTAGIKAKAAALAALVAGALGGPHLLDVPGASAATTITVNTVSQQVNGDGFCSLPEAMYAANLDDNVAPDPANPGQMLDTACPGGSGTDTILLASMGDYTVVDPIDDADNHIGPAATPIVTTPIVIEGNGARFRRLGGGRLTRAFVVGAGGDLTLRELHVQGFGIEGGDGGPGGGGGLGAGGAIYVHGGSLSVDRSTFDANTARGGDGGAAAGFSLGGGGGMFGDGGDSSFPNGTTLFTGGGGGGSRGAGGHGAQSNDGGGGGGRVTAGQIVTPGEPCGGKGGESSGFGSDDGDDAECAGGGGGGGTERETPFDPFCGGAGGDGGYGGGGGGGGQDGNGGNGGFGGGGGAGGGDGGFGGGGGSMECALFPNAGAGGTFAGDGANRTGGGGAGLGGAIFGHDAAIDIVNSTFSANTATKGDFGGGEANDGRGGGGAIFAVGGSLTVDSSTIADNAAVGTVGLGGGGIVVYEPDGTSASLRLRNTIVAGNGPSECYTRGGVSTTGSVSNLIADSTVNAHDDGPCPGVVTSEDPQIGSLTLNAPGLTPTFKIAATSPALDGADGATSPGVDQRGLERPQGADPDIGAYELATIPPVTTITLDPASPDGTNGWYRTAVGMSVTAVDPDGAVDQTRCALDPSPVPGSFDDLPDAECALTNVAADGEHAIFAASRDIDGNIEATLAQAAFKLDATGPVLTPSLNTASTVVGQTGVFASPNASDATSGVASASCAPVDTSTPGARSLTCTATDNAGNTATAELTYVVEYRILGIFQPAPMSAWKVGQTVPVKIALGDHAGVRITDGEGAALARACRVTFSATGAQTRAAQCFKYDARNDQFIYNWKLAKTGTGAATIEIAISYPGSSLQTTLSQSIIISS